MNDISLPTPTSPDALIIGIGEATIVTADGEVETTPIKSLKARLKSSICLICHEPGVAARLGVGSLSGQLDVLDLFAFVHPAQFCLPTPSGLANALDLPPPGTDATDQAVTLFQAWSTRTHIWRPMSLNCLALAHRLR